MIRRVRRAAAAAVLLIGAALALPGQSASAAPVEACEPSPKTATSLCLTYDLQVLAAGTENPTTQSLAPIDVRLAFANTSTDYVNQSGQPRWINSVTANLLSSDTIRPEITGTADLPDQLLVGGSAAGCGPGGDFSFSACDAGYGVAYVKLSGVLYNGVYKATFGIDRIYSDKANLGDHHSAFTADISICADLSGGAMSCDQQVDSSATLTLDLPAPGEPFVLDFALPSPSVPFHTVQALAADSATIHLLGRSDKLANGNTVSAKTVVALPAECGTVSGSGTAHTGLGSITVDESFEITGCTTLTAMAAKSSIKYGSSTTVSGTLVDDAEGALVGETVTLKSCPVGGSCSNKQATTTDGGAYSFTVKPKKNTTYTVSHTPTFRSSAPVLVTVKPKVTINTDRSSMPVGGRVKLTGKVSPVHAGKTVKIQRLASGTWTTIASATLSAKSTYAKGVNLGGAPGVVKLRVVLPKHADHAAGTSAAKGVKLV